MIIGFWGNLLHGLLQDCNISITNALEILQSCTKPSICVVTWLHTYMSHNAWEFTVVWLPLTNVMHATHTALYGRRSVGGFCQSKIYIVFCHISVVLFAILHICTCQKWQIKICSFIWYFTLLDYQIVAVNYMHLDEYGYCAIDPYIYTIFLFISIKKCDSKCLEDYTDSILFMNWIKILFGLEPCMSHKLYKSSMGSLK